MSKAGLLGVLLVALSFIVGPILMIMAIKWAFSVVIPITLWSWFIFFLIELAVGVSLGFIRGVGEALLK